MLLGMALLACGGETRPEFRHDAERATGWFAMFADRLGCECDQGPNGLHEISCGPVKTGVPERLLEFAFPEARHLRTDAPLTWILRDPTGDTRIDGGFALYTELDEVVVEGVPYQPIWFERAVFPRIEECAGPRCDEPEELVNAWMYCESPY